MSISPEVQSKLVEWRAKAAAGTMTIEEMREAILLMRNDRRSAAHASETARRSKAKKEVKSADDLLDELGI